jgi:hypothetical protein
MFPVRYEPDLYILFRRNSVFKGLEDWEVRGHGRFQCSLYEYLGALSWKLGGTDRYNGMQHAVPLPGKKAQFFTLSSAGTEHHNVYCPVNQ